MWKRAGGLSGWWIDCLTVSRSHQTQTTNCGALVIDPQNSATLYCSANDVLRSTDAGASWSAVGSGLAGSIRSLTIDPRDPTELYAGTSGGLFVIDVGPSTSADRYPQDAPLNRQISRTSQKR